MFYKKCNEILAMSFVFEFEYQCVLLFAYFENVCIYILCVFVFYDAYFKYHSMVM